MEQVVDAEEVAATKLEEAKEVVEMREIITTAITITTGTRSTAGTTAPFASRTNTPMELDMLTLHTLVPQRHLLQKLCVRVPRMPTYRIFRLLFAMVRNPRVTIKSTEHGLPPSLLAPSGRWNSTC